jgi:steryl-sulfatase
MKIVLFILSVWIALARQPNFVVFLIDDLGYGDLGAYGNTTCPTPNIDKLAKEGVLFTQMISAEGICTPSRTGFLTGRYPSRSGMSSSSNSFRTLNSPAQAGGLPQSEITLARLLRTKGYRTAAIGKWHLGLHEHLPTRHGFDFFYGLPVTNVQTCGGKVIYNTVGGGGKVFKQTFPGFVWRRTKWVWTSWVVITLSLFLLGFISKRSAIFLIFLMFVAFAMAWWYIKLFTLLNRASCVLLRNEEIVQQPVQLQNLTVQNTEEAIQFIKNGTQPFFLYFAMVKVHTALFTSLAFTNKTKKGAYVDNVAEMDWGVGRVIDTIKEMGLDRDTMFFFSSDNGPFVTEGIEAGSCGGVVNKNGEYMSPLKGSKGEAWECGIRVPGILKMSGIVPAGIVKNTTYSLMDIYPTFAAMAGIDLPTDRIIDGQNMMPSLLDKEKSYREYLIHYCGDKVVAARYKNFKAHFEIPIWDDGEKSCPSLLICSCQGMVQDPPLLYDLDLDPIESNPLEHTDENKEILHKIQDYVAIHKKTVVPVTNQLETLANPFMFPCCKKNDQNRTRIVDLFYVATNNCGCD